MFNDYTHFSSECANMSLANIITELFSHFMQNVRLLDFKYFFLALQDVPDASRIFLAPILQQFLQRVLETFIGKGIRKPG